MSSLAEEYGAGAPRLERYGIGAAEKMHFASRWRCHAKRRPARKYDSMVSGE